MVDSLHFNFDDDITIFSTTPQINGFIEKHSETPFDNIASIDGIDFCTDFKLKNKANKSVLKKANELYDELVFQVKSANITVDSTSYDIADLFLSPYFKEMRKYETSFRIMPKKGITELFSVLDEDYMQTHLGVFNKTHRKVFKHIISIIKNTWLLDNNIPSTEKKIDDLSSFLSPLEIVNDYESVERIDLSGLEQKAREIARSLISSNNLLKLKSLKTFITNNLNDIELIQKTLISLPYKLLDQLVLHLPLPDTKDIPWDKIISQNIINECMKRSEFCVRRSHFNVPKYSPNISSVTYTDDDYLNDSINSIPVYSSNGLVSPGFLYRSLTDEELVHYHLNAPKSCTNNVNQTTKLINCKLNELSVVSSQRRFERNLEAFLGFHPSLLNLGLMSNAVLMGGSVLACLLPLPENLENAHKSIEEYESLIKQVTRLPLFLVKHLLSFSRDYELMEIAIKHDLRLWYLHSPFSNSDCDIFVTAESNEIYHADEKKAEENSFYYARALAHSLDQQYKYFTRTHTAITFCGVGLRNLQIIPCPKKSPLDILMDFDLDCATFAYDGNCVFTIPRGRRAITTSTNFVDPFVIRFNRTRERIAKYFYRGFSFLLYEACKHSPRCDVLLDFPVYQMCLHTEEKIYSMFPNSKKPKENEMNDDDDDDGIWKADGAFYSGDIFAFSSSLHYRSIDSIIHRITKFRWKLTDKSRLIHDASLEKLLNTTMKPLPTELSLNVGGEPKRVGHSCYQCQELTSGEFNELLCAKCSSINKIARELSFHHWNKTAFVTGCRIKVGFQICLKLLRCHVTVIGTSRFPKLALQRFASQKDYADWSKRLFIYGVDLRSIPSLMQLLDKVKNQFKQINYIINNAAQTVRRPPAYYRALVEKELSICDIPNSSSIEESKSNQISQSLIENPTANITSIMSKDEIYMNSNASTLSTQIPVLPGDEIIRNDVMFPPNYTGRDGEQIDLRKNTSWNAQIEQIHVAELLEVQLINVNAPFIIIKELLPLMPEKGINNFIINVSSPEGQFDTPFSKKGFHPHTNMAKASLNMLSRTLAGQLLPKHIYIYSIDTGWISDMRPWLNNKPVRMPLTEVDGAARILHPILSYPDSAPPWPSGSFLKHFNLAPW